MRRFTPKESRSWDPRMSALIVRNVRLEVMAMAAKGR